VIRLTNIACLALSLATSSMPPPPEVPAERPSVELQHIQQTSASGPLGIEEIDPSRFGTLNKPILDDNEALLFLKALWAPKPEWRPAMSRGFMESYNRRCSDAPDSGPACCHSDVILTANLLLEGGSWGVIMVHLLERFSTDSARLIMSLATYALCRTNLYWASIEYWWPEDATLQEGLHKAYSPQVALEHNGLRFKDLLAYNLEAYVGMRIVFTDNLQMHLRLCYDNTELFVFCDVESLKANGR
jgi:hypothetical protein